MSANWEQECLNLAEQAPHLTKHQLSYRLYQLVHEQMKQVEAATIERMAEPPGDIERRLRRAEEVAQRHQSGFATVGMTTEMSLANELLWACTELRKRSGEVKRG